MAPSFLVFVVVVTIPEGFLDDCDSADQVQDYRPAVREPAEVGDGGCAGGGTAVA